jgi:RNA polymerase sigma factor (sigma-70 family)
VARLSALGRKVFQLYYWKGYSREEIQQTHAAEASSSAIAEAFQQLDDALAGSRTQLPKPHIRVPFDEETGALEKISTDDKEIAEWMERWLADLPPQERMILRLKFWEEMTAKEIAAAMHIDNEQRVYTILRSALKQLRERTLRTFGK